MSLVFQAYLNGRSQQIRNQCCFSDEKQVFSGVRKGSIVAGLLFIICIKTLPDLCKSVFPLLCADDVKFIAINRLKIAVQIILSGVKKWRWSDCHGFPLNTGNCHDMSLSNNNTKYCFAKSTILEKDCQRNFSQ